MFLRCCLLAGPPASPSLRTNTSQVSGGKRGAVALSGVGFRLPPSTSTQVTAGPLPLPLLCGRGSAAQAAGSQGRIPHQQRQGPCSDQRVPPTRVGGPRSADPWRGVIFLLPLRRAALAKVAARWLLVPGPRSQVSGVDRRGFRKEGPGLAWPLSHWAPLPVCSRRFRVQCSVLVDTLSVCP